MNVTLSIGASYLRLLAVAGGRARKWGEAQIEPGLVRDGVIVKPNAVAAAINALFHSAGVKRRRVTVSLSGLSFTYRRLRLPRLRSALGAESIMRTARKEIAMPLEDLYLSWQPIGSTPDSYEVFIVGAPRAAIDSVTRTLAEAGIRPDAMDLGGLALARAAGRDEAIIVSLDTDSFDTVLVAGGGPAILHTMAPRGEGAGIADNIVRLTDELARMLEFHSAAYPDSSLRKDTPLLLTGALSADPTVSALIQDRTGHPVAPLVAPLHLPPDLPPAAFATNIGLALRKPRRRPFAGQLDSAYDDVKLNLLSGKYGAETLASRTMRVVIPLVFAAAVGFLYPAYLGRLGVNETTEDLRASLERANRLLLQARLAADEASQIEARISELLAAADALRQGRDILGRRGQATDDLGIVAGSVTADRYFTSIEVGPEQVTMTGEATNTEAVIDYASEIEATGAYSDVRIDELDDGTTVSAEGVPEGEVTFKIVMTR